MGIWAGATRSRSSQGGVDVGLENFIPASGSGYWRSHYKNGREGHQGTRFFNTNYQDHKEGFQMFTGI